MELVAAQGFPGLLVELVERAVEQGADPHLAERARWATERGLRVPDGAVSVQTRRRAEAYFSAVLRRTALRERGSRRLAARFVVASVVEDLLLAGRSGSEVWSELQRGWSEQVPGDVLEEYRLRLCG